MTFTTVMPQLTHDTAVGRAGISGYATLGGGSAEEALSAPVPYTAQQAGSAIAPLLTSPDHNTKGTFILGPDGLLALPG